MIARKLRREGSVADQRAWTEHKPAPKGLSGLDFRGLWRYRQVAVVLASRDVKLRYRQTAFGVAWVLIQPLAAMAFLGVVFGKLAHVPSDGIAYPVFAYAGYALWSYAANAAQSGASVVVDTPDLVTKLYFPRLLALVAALLPGLLDLAVMSAGLAVLLVIYGGGGTAAVLLTPLWVLAAAAAALGVGTWLAALNVRYRDVKYGLPFLMQLWFFTSPVAFPSSLFTGVDRLLYSVNPLVGPIDGFRWSVLAGPSPTAGDALSLAVGVIVLVSGVGFFRSFEPHFADFV